MAAIIWANVTALAPDVAELDIQAQTEILGYVNKALNPRMFTKEALRLARMNLAAHIATNALSEESDEDDADYAGPVVSETTGRISRTYAAIKTATSGGTLADTTFGDFFNFLVNTSKARLPFVLTGRGGGRGPGSLGC